jgi:hypothetical protein
MLAKHVDEGWLEQMTLEEEDAAKEQDRLNDMDEMKAKYRAALVAYYETCAPDGLDKVDAVIKQNLGEEDFLLEALLKKWSHRAGAQAALGELKYAIENMLGLRERLEQQEQNVQAAKMMAEAGAVLRMWEELEEEGTGLTYWHNAQSGAMTYREPDTVFRARALYDEAHRILGKPIPSQVKQREKEKAAEAEQRAEEEQQAEVDEEEAFFELEREVLARPATHHSDLSGSHAGSRPATAAGAAEVQDEKGDPWEEHQDEEGNTYFWNSETGESAWERPAAKRLKALVRTGLLQGVAEETGGGDAAW